MKVTFAIFFCVILGVTTAKHLFNEEYKGFETGEDLSLARQEDTEYDDPEQMMRKKLFDLAEGLKVLAECLKGGNGKKHECFKQFKESIKLPPAGHKCIADFEKCENDVPGIFLRCADEFRKCVHVNTALV